MLIVIVSIVAIGLLIGFFNNLKVKKELREEYQNLEDRDNDLKTKPPYKIAQPYYNSRYDCGIVVSSKRYVPFSAGIKNFETAKDALNAFYVSVNMELNKIDLEEYKKGISYQTIPSIDDLQVFGEIYDVYMSLKRRYKPHDNSDIRSEELAEILVSRNINENGEVLAYNLKTKKIFSIPISAGFLQGVSGVGVLTFDVIK